MTPHDCAQKGHIWLEGKLPEPVPIPDGGSVVVLPVVFRRHRGRPPGLVAVYCRHCLKTTELEGHGAYTRGPGDRSPVDHRIPAPFQAVLDRAVAAAPAPPTAPTSARLVTDPNETE